MTAPFTPDTLKVIKRNAGRVPKAEIAASLGWSVSQVERVAREHGIGLAMVERSALPDESPSLRRSHTPPSALRTESVTTQLLPSDLRLIDAACAKAGLKRSRLMSRLVENARARGLIEDLTALPAPMPEHIGNLDE